MNALTPLVQQMLGRKVPHEIEVMRDEILNTFPNADFILTYGSVLRGASPFETLIDFYVAVPHPRDISKSRISRLAAQLIPPNVYYIEIGQSPHQLRSKCTVLTSDAFIKGVSAKTRNPYFWARFSQPSVLVYARDTIAALRASSIVSQAIRTAAAHAAALAPQSDSVTQWSELYHATYRTEFRPEGTNRAQGIVEQNRTWYEGVAASLPNQVPRNQNWFLARLVGKSLTILRLAKAAFTFKGGADYAAWKINRHAGSEIKLSEWQRKHPIIAGVLMLPRLLRNKLIR
jgi:hypothetical protein